MHLLTGFDQSAAAVVIARLASHNMETEEEFDATRWLDRTLIRLTSRFGDYVKDQPDSMNLNSNMTLFPQFMFNLRRSPFVQVVTNSIPRFSSLHITYTHFLPCFANYLIVRFQFRMALLYLLRTCYI